MSWNLQRLLQGSSLGQIAERIIAHDIDVVGFQEIEEGQASDLAGILGWDNYYVQAKDPSDESNASETGCLIDVFFEECDPFGNAILSRYPMPVEQRSLTLLPVSDEELGKEYRNLLGAQISVEGVTFHLYNTHFGANPGDDTGGGWNPSSASRVRPQPGPGRPECRIDHVPCHS